MNQLPDVIPVQISGYIEYARLIEDSDNAYIVIGLLPDGSTALQEVSLPPLEKDLAYKIHDLFNQYAEEIDLTVSEEAWETGQVCEFTVSYIDMTENKLLQEITIAYKNRYGKLSEMVKPTVCLFGSDGEIYVYDLEEGLEVALKTISNLNNLKSPKERTEIMNDTTNLQKCMDNSYRLSLDEAIAHAEEVAERLANSHANSGEDCKLCAIEHEQLATWLKELRMYRELEVFKSLKTETGYVVELSSDKTSGERDGLIGIVISETDHLFNIHLTAKDFSKASKAFLEGKKVKVDVCEFMSLEGRNLEILDI